jgi:transcriptional regulator with PAS, ATPase and Fis domain
VVALESSPASGHSSVEAIRALKQNGFKILAYEDGLRNWSLTARCVPLLAGATQLVDSAKEGFPVELQRLLIRLRRLETERTAEERQVRRVMLSLGMVGESQPMLALFRTVLRVSVLSDLPTLLTGETGTGKECLARAVHQLDPKRRTGPFIALNCGALTPTLAESELFGHRRGAFTGAERERKGLIRAAHGGVLFLDEIGELSEPLQAKLLRVLQENHVLAVGDEHEVAVSVRVVAATNRNLIEMVQQGRFRADLFHRLNVLSVNVPALRERPADVLPLIQFFLSKHRLLKPTGNLAADEEFVEAIKQADLPGNVRQLESLICQALVNKETDTPLDLSDLPIEILRQLSAEKERAVQTAKDATALASKIDEPVRSAPRQDEADLWSDLLDVNGGSLVRSLECCERDLLAAALRRTRGNQSQTARLLGITSRSVYNKVHRHQLNELLKTAAQRLLAACFLLIPSAFDAFFII